jgi:hypothetical protein
LLAHLDAASGRSHLAEMSALALTQFTRDKASRPTPAAERQHDVIVPEVFENAASVKVIAASWIDYLHPSRFNACWVIVNVLWEMKPGQPFVAYW